MNMLIQVCILGTLGAQIVVKGQLSMVRFQWTSWLLNNVFMSFWVIKCVWDLFLLLASKWLWYTRFFSATPGLWVGRFLLVFVIGFQAPPSTAWWCFWLSSLMCNSHFFRETVKPPCCVLPILGVRELSFTLPLFFPRGLFALLKDTRSKVFHAFSDEK